MTQPSSKDFKEIDLPALLENNAVKCKADIYHAVRGLVHVPRAHTLAMTHRESILEHCAKCVQLLDFLHAQNLITPKLELEDYLKLRNYMFYHDSHEIFTGDIPYYVEKCLGNQPSRVRDIITKAFGVDVQLTPEVFQLSKMLDALEFFITISEDPKLSIPYEQKLRVDGEGNILAKPANTMPFEVRRLRKIQENAKSILDKYLESSMKYTINYSVLFSLSEGEDLLDS